MKIKAIRIDAFSELQHDHHIHTINIGFLRYAAYNIILTCVCCAFANMTNINRVVDLTMVMVC